MADVATQEGGFSEATLKQLECPICLEYCTPPIYQCSNGHNVCFVCLTKTNACSLCRQPMTTVRNLLAEQISSLVQHPCRFKAEGCTAMRLLSEMGAHLSTCQHGLRCVVDTPTGSCEWVGRRHRLRSHVEQCHPQWATKGTAVVILFSPREFQAVLISCHNQLFWCLFFRDSDEFTQRVYVFCVADDSTAEEFIYETRLASKNEQCVIINRGTVEPFKSGSVEKCRVDKSGKNIIVSGKHMMQRFTRNNFKCNVRIRKI